MLIDPERMLFVIRLSNDGLRRDPDETPTDTEDSQYNVVLLNQV